VRICNPAVLVTVHRETFCEFCKGQVIIAVCAGDGDAAVAAAAEAASGAQLAALALGHRADWRLL
jgi:hypothetical protein